MSVAASGGPVPRDTDGRAANGVAAGGVAPRRRARATACRGRAWRRRTTVECDRDREAVSHAQLHLGDVDPQRQAISG